MIVEIDNGKHRCDLGNPDFGNEGRILECSVCGRWWRNIQPGNPLYARWKRAWIRQLFSRRRRG